MDEISRENTSLQQALARVAELERMLGESQEALECVRHLVSHDFRAPLRAIDGFSRILKEDYASELHQEGVAYLDRIHGSIAVLAKLIEGTLAFLRPIEIMDAARDIDLSSLAREVVAELRQSDPNRQADIVIEDSPAVRGYEPLCRSLLRYLLENAWKFTSHNDSTRIVFDSLTDRGQRIYYVQDNGIGFDMLYVEKLFQPFQRLHSLSHFPGNGFGLALAQRIVNYLNGRIWADAETNRGATFYFTLGPRA